jgi:D-sedoheptulose 7-phosphate isomerase
LSLIPYFTDPAEGSSLSNEVDSYFRKLARAAKEVECTGPHGETFSRSEAYDRTLALSLEATEHGNKLMFIGNGGSAAIASHMAIDFSKNGGMRAVCFNDGAALTCLGNDFGYEEVFARQLGFYAQPGDILYAISSSGRSPNMILAVEEARRHDCRVITMTGFRADNPLRAMGDVNFYVALEAYGIVEVAHAALIHAVVDLRIGRTLHAHSTTRGEQQ